MALLYTSAASPSGPIGWEDEWVPEPIRSLWERERFVASHYDRNLLPEFRPTRSIITVPTVLLGCQTDNCTAYIIALLLYTKLSFVDLFTVRNAMLFEALSLMPLRS